MIIFRKAPNLPYSSITARSLYLNRRGFLASLALGISGGAAIAGTKLNAVKSPFSTTEALTPYQDVTTYNNFYEFGTAKSDPSHNAKNFRTAPWQAAEKVGLADQLAVRDCCFRVLRRSN